MALDFHNRENNEHLFALTDSQYNALQEILEELTRWTGQTIDQYRDSYMDKNIQMTLLRLIDKYVQKTNLNEEKTKVIEILCFRGLLKHYMNKDISFQIYGD